MGVSSYRYRVRLEIEIDQGVIRPSTGRGRTRRGELVDELSSP